jgi:hypothetical protein
MDELKELVYVVCNMGVEIFLNIYSSLSQSICDMFCTQVEL